MNLNNYSARIIPPKVEDIEIGFIASVLSKLCRFGGKCNPFYSVAEHSISISYLAEDIDVYKKYKKDFLLYSLLHDAGETWLLDLPSPIKYMKGFEVYRDLLAQCDLAVCTKYLKYPNMMKTYHDWLNETDKRLQVTEAKVLMPEGFDCLCGNDFLPYEGLIIAPTDIATNEHIFLTRFKKLYDSPKW